MKLEPHYKLIITANSRRYNMLTTPAELTVLEVAGDYDTVRAALVNWQYPESQPTPAADQLERFHDSLTELPKEG